MENKTTDKRQHILDVAVELFAEHGYEGTSIRMLAKEAMVNVAMINYYFGSKEKLFEALVEEKTDFVRERLQKLNNNEGNSFDKLEEAIDIYVERVLSNNKFHRIVQREISLQQRSVITDNILEILMRSAKEFIKLINEGIIKKEFRKVDPELTVVTIIGTIFKAVQSTSFCKKFIGHNEEVHIQDEPHRSRLKNHLKDLMHAHLQLQK